jgi:23S rRNA (guanosine2251-2'-O)-methyltransferase
MGVRKTKQADPGKEIICGTRAVTELLRARKRRCYEILIAQGKRERAVCQIESMASELGVPVRYISNEELSAIATIEKHQGVAAKTDSFSFDSLQNIIKKAKNDSKKGFLLVLDGILDPHNLGSLIRTAHQTGVHGLILPKDNSAPVGAAAVKASAGASEYLPIALVTNIVSTLNELKNNGFWIVGTDASSQSSLYLFDFTKDNYVLVLGGEGRGIRRLVRENCDFLLAIPMFGNIDSYNVSVAGAVFMSEIMRQRNFKINH